MDNYTKIKYTGETDVVVNQGYLGRICILILLDT